MHMFKNKREAVTADEGFAFVSHARNETEVRAILQSYCSAGGACGGTSDTDGTPMDIPGDDTPAGDLFARAAADIGIAQPKNS